MALNNNFYSISKRHEENPLHSRSQPAVSSSTMKGLRSKSVEVEINRSGYATPSPRASPSVLERYPPASTESLQIHNGPTRKTGSGQPPPLAPSSYYREDPVGRNFATLPINRTTARSTVLPFPEAPAHRSVPNSPQPVKAPTPSYSRSSSNSPFGTGHRQTPVLDKYPSVLTLNEVKVTPLPGIKIGRYSASSAVPSVLDRYPPAANENNQKSNRNAGTRGSSSVPASPSVEVRRNKMSPQNSEDNSAVNRFQSPATPVGAVRRAAPVLSRYPAPQQQPPPPPPKQELPPPPPLPPIQQTFIHVESAAPASTLPNRQPSAVSNFVRKPSLKIKRNPSIASVNGQRAMLGVSKVTTQPPPVPRRKGPPPNRPSKLLNDIENNLVFQILGHGRKTISTAVVQLLLPFGDYANGWSLEGVTVLCFVRDPSKKSYFLEFLSLAEGSCIMACEIYEEFSYTTKGSSKFITFEAENFCVGVNFADGNEFLDFKDTLDKKIDSKRIRRQDRKSSRIRHHNQPTSSTFLTNGHGQPESEPIVKDSRKYLFTFGKKGPKSKNRKKVAKRDIGTPLNFQHISHAGFDPEHGFQSYGDIDISKYQELFEKAKVSQKQLNDPATRKFIYAFVENYEKDKEISHITSDQVTTPEMDTPPTPTRPLSLTIPPREPAPDYNHQADRAPPPPPRSPKAKRPPPPPSSPPFSPTSAIPPPPPMPSSTDLQPLALKPERSEVNELTSPVSPDEMRSNFLREIEQGAKGKLKPVSQDSNLEKPKDNVVNGMAGALQRALLERSRAINPETSESETEDDAFDSDEWEDD